MDSELFSHVVLRVSKERSMSTDLYATMGFEDMTPGSIGTPSYMGGNCQEGA